METATVESWVKHERQFARVTNTDKVIEEGICSFSIEMNPENQ
jgi:hypothetical protein